MKAETEVGTNTTRMNYWQHLFYKQLKKSIYCACAHLLASQRHHYKGYGLDSFLDGKVGGRSTPSGGGDPFGNTLGRAAADFAK